MGFLTNKRALIMGLVSKRSLAAGVAESMHREGAELSFTYQTEKLKDRVTDLASHWNSNLVIPCDVAKDDEIKSAFQMVKEAWPDGFDILVHSIAFAPKEELDGDYASVATREGFRIAHDISSFSLTAVAQAAQPLMKGRNGSIVTLSYLGAERAITNYNVMGLAKASLEANVRYLAASLGPEGTRVNAVSAGPVKTLAASGIGDFRKMQNVHEKTAPLRRNITQEEVGNACAFLCSDLSSGITGEILYVDAGYNIAGTNLAE